MKNVKKYLIRVKKVLGWLLDFVAGLILIITHFIAIIVVIAIVLVATRARLKIDIATIPFTDNQVLILKGPKEAFEFIFSILKYAKYTVCILLYWPIYYLGKILRGKEEE